MFPTWENQDKVVGDQGWVGPSFEECSLAMMVQTTENALVMRMHTHHCDESRVWELPDWLYVREGDESEFDGWKASLSFHFPRVWSVESVNSFEVHRREKDESVGHFKGDLDRAWWRDSTGVDAKSPMSATRMGQGNGHGSGEDREARRGREARQDAGEVMERDR